MGEMLGSAIPELTGMLLRGRLVRLFARQAPPLTLVCAAAGYGKTVLATQLARNGGFDAVLWVELPDTDASGELILRQVADALDRQSMDGSQPDSETAHSLGFASLDDMVRVRGALQQHSGIRLLVVVDGVSGLSSPAVLESLAEGLGQYTSSASRMVITCRRVEGCGNLNPGTVWVLEEPDLAFTVSEVSALVADSAGDSSGPDAVTIHECYSGHPAITRIMVRHGAPTVDAQPRDLIWQTERVVSRLTETEVAALYLASILREGNVGMLQQCGAACDLSVDWRALSRGVPLLLVSAGAQGAATFRVHAVLADVVAGTG